MKISRVLIVATAALAGACRSAAVVAPTTPVTPPRLAATKFVAYGDGITEGIVERCPGNTADAARGLRIGFLQAQGRARPSPTAYPLKLQEMLAARYPSQTITVINEGAAGEDIHAGVVNLPRVLTTDMPEVLLLQEGAHTLDTSHRDGIPLVIDGLKTMIQEARSRSITVLVGTLLPQRPGGCRAQDFEEGSDDIIETNVRLRRLVGTEGAVLVDLYEAFNGRTAMFIGEDGLHPSAAGYERIAQEFFTAIRRYLET